MGRPTGTPHRQAGRDAWVGFGCLLFAVTVTVYLLSGATFLGYDGEMMYRVAESLVQRHSFQVTDPIYHVNEPYSFYGLAVSLLLSPLVALGSLLFHDGRSLVTLYEPSITALTVVSLHRLLLELGCSWRRSLGVALLFAFGSLAWHYSGVLFSEPLIALMGTLSLLWLLYFRRSQHRRWLVAVGLATGLSMLARLDSLLVVVLPLSAYLVFRVLKARPDFSTRVLHLAAYALPVVFSLGVNVMYDLARYSHPLQTGYGVEGADFSTPLLKGLFGLLLSPGAGLLIFVPIVALAALGFPRLFRMWKAEAMLIAGLLVVRLLLYARWWAWDGGATFGPRFLVPLLPLLLIPIAFVPWDRRVWNAALALSTASVGIELLDQLVPYGLYYSQVAPVLAAKVGVAACPGCGPSSMPAVQAVKEIMDFNWRFTPLVMQFKLLLQGTIDPGWRPIALLMPLILVVIGAILLHLVRMAARFDAKRWALR